MRDTVPNDAIDAQITEFSSASSTSTHAPPHQRCASTSGGACSEPSSEASSSVPQPTISPQLASTNSATMNSTAHTSPTGTERDGRRLSSASGTEPSQPANANSE